MQSDSAAARRVRSEPVRTFHRSHRIGAPRRQRRILLASLALGATTLSALGAMPEPRVSGAAGAAPRVLWDEEVEAVLIGSGHAHEHLEARALAPRPRARRASFALGAPGAFGEVGASPEIVGEWGPALTPTATRGIPAVHAVLLHTGKVLVWAAYGTTSADGTMKDVQTVAGLLDPATNTLHAVDPPYDMNVFCGGATILGNGTVLVVGGLYPEQAVGRWNSSGIPVALVFDPVTETWTRLPDMRDGRWYPTLVELADGSAAIFGGRKADETANHDVETIGLPPDSAPQLRTLLPLDWRQGLYPKEFLLPDGQILSYAGSRTDFLSPESWAISPGPASHEVRHNYPGAVLLPLHDGAPATMFLTGGKSPTDVVSGTTEQLDLGTATPAFEYRAPLPQPRTNMNLVNLPDGTLLGVGGNSIGKNESPQLEALRYDPTTDTWTTLAAQAKRRAYHSTALLLPSGEVLSAGDDYVGGGRTTYEIFRPPYLFRGPRPTITGVTPTAAPGDTIHVSTSPEVTRAVLIAPGAVTHATDMHQRMIELTLTGTTLGEFDAIIPDANTAPPGPYMVFALDADGVPSVAEWIWLGATVPGPPPALAADHFARSVTGGWGTAEIGGAWTVTAPTSSWVNTSVAQLRAGVGQTRRASLTDTTLTAASSAVTFTADKPATGGGTMISIIGRRISNTLEYRARVRVTPTGAVRIAFTRLDGTSKESYVGTEIAVTGLTFTPGTSLRMRFDVVGTNPTLLRARVWRADEAEPTTWKISAIDATPALQSAGAVGVALRLSSTATNAPVVATFDDFEVVAPT